MKIMIPFLRLMLVIAFLSTQAFAQNQEQAFDELLTELFPDDGPGGTAIVTKKGKTLYLKAFGKAQLELDIEMQPQHIFRIGSITKQFTACAILKLMEEGKLSLDDDITKFIEDYPTHGHTITIEHLLTHTSGIKSYTGMEKWDAEVRKQDFTPEEMIDYFKNEPMDFAPGEKWAYNNSGYFILGHIIEKLSGKSYAAYISEAFFEPLGMKNSYYGNTSKVIPNRTAGYQPEGEGFVNADFLSMTQPYAAGSLLSTVEDLSTWYHALVAGKVISLENLKKAHTSYKLNDGEPTGYGFGWSLGNIQGSPMFQHGGGINGYITASLFLPEQEVFVAVFSNCNCHFPGDAAFKLAGIAIDKPFAYKKIEVKDKDLAAYEGVYEFESNQTRTITVEEGQLYSLRTGGSKQLITPYEKDKFFFPNFMTILEFQRTKKGAITGVISKSTSPDILWKRTDKEIQKTEYIELEEALLQKYVGKYQLAPGFIISITKEGNQMFAQATGQPKLEIKAYEKHKFELMNVDAKLIFNLDEEGIVQSLTLLQNGENLAKKIE